MTVISLKLGKYIFSPSLIPSLAFLMMLPFLISLGNWQLSRADEKQLMVDDQAQRQMDIPVNLNATVISDIQSNRFRPAQAVGHYLKDQQWLLDNRLFRGQAGYDVFSLFQLENAGQLLINRGWVSVGQSRSVLPKLPLPEGKIQLSGHLDTPASVGVKLADKTEDSIEAIVLLQSLDVKTLAAARGLMLQALPLVLAEGQSAGLQFTWAPVETISPEKHLGYAAQWYALSVALFIIYFGVNTRRLTKKEPDNE